MKKLVLFLSLCVTNIVYGSQESALEKVRVALNTIDERVGNGTFPDYNKKDEIALLTNPILKAVIDISNFNPDQNVLINEKEVSGISTLVATVIEHVKNLNDGALRGAYATIFADLYPCDWPMTEDDFLGARLLADFKKSEKEKDYVKRALRAFHASLCINYVFFILEDKSIEERSNYASKVINKIYNLENGRGLAGSSLKVICKSAKKINTLSPKPLSEQEIIEFFRKFIPESSGCFLWQCIDTVFAKEAKPSSWKNFPSKKVAGTGTVLVVVGGSYYVVEKTKYGKRLKKFEQENPNTAKALKVLAGIVVGGVLYTLNK